MSKYRGNVKRLIPSLVALAVLVTPLFAVSEAFAAAASISLSAPKTAAKGSTITVNVYVSTDTAATGAGAKLSYPVNLLDFVSIGNSSAYSIAAPSSGGGGNVTINKGATPGSPASGRQLLAPVRFKVKTDTGNATVNVTGGNVYATDDSDIYRGGSGTTFALTPPAAAPQAAPKDTTAPKVSDVTVTEVSINSASITWKTDEPTNSIVNYGFNTSYGILAQDNNMVTDHKVTLNPAVLGPVTNVHFQVKSTDAAGNVGQSENQQFTTKGFTLNLKVTDKNTKEPVKGAVVKLENSKAATTNDKGIAKVENLPGGTVLGTVTYSDKETFVSINIKPLTDMELAVQDGSVAIDAPKSNMMLFGGLALLLLVLVVLTILAVTGKIGRSGNGLDLGSKLATLKDKLSRKNSTESNSINDATKISVTEAPSQDQGTLLSSEPENPAPVVSSQGDNDENNPTVIRPSGQ